jgi:hypothetical protein
MFIQLSSGGQQVLILNLDIHPAKLDFTSLPLSKVPFPLFKYTPIARSPLLLLLSTSLVGAFIPFAWAYEVCAASAFLILFH